MIIVLQNDTIQTFNVFFSVVFGTSQVDSCAVFSVIQLLSFEDDNKYVIKLFGLFILLYCVKLIRETNGFQ